MLLEIARSIREDFLHQNAFHPVDTYTSFAKQRAMMKVIMHIHEEMTDAIQKGTPSAVLFDLPIREEVARMRYLPEEDIKKLGEFQKKISEIVRIAAEEQEST